VSSSELLGAALRRSAPAARRVRRALLVRRVQVLAAAAGADVEVDVALDAQVGRGVRVEVTGPGRLRIGPGAVIGDGVVLQLKGGSIELGAWSDVRRGAVLNVSGRFVLGESTVLGAGSTVHCAHEVLVGARGGIGEYSTLVDTSHLHTAPGRPVVYDTVPGRVVVGDDVFIGTKCTLARDAVIGDFCFVGAGSVVVGEVPARTFVSGVPARHVKDVVLPWE
jgi:carbonic anhydrase/acetyltransferase-like protein (isoleucine patch superfamily)